MAAYTFQAPERRIHLLLLVVVVLLPSLCLSQTFPPRRAGCHHCVPAAIRDEVAIGFNLGQSYGTAVAHFDNGTILPLACVPARPAYLALRERPQQHQGPPAWQQFLARWPRVDAARRRLGIPRSRDAAALRAMLADLKAAAEAVLRRPVRRVAVAQPHRHPYAWTVVTPGPPAPGDLHDALLGAGLEPWDGLGGAGGGLGDEAEYVGELSAALGATGRWLCLPYRCVEVPDWEVEPAQGVFLVSMTNRSLYTSFQSAKCFHKSPWDWSVVIHPDLGLDSIEGATTPEASWDRVRSQLARDILQAAEWLRGPPYPSPLELVLVTGSGADHPELRSAVRDVVGKLTKAQIEPGRRSWSTEGEGGETVVVELVFVDDPVFAAAKGAAFWQRLRLEAAWYCPTHECCPQRHKIPLTLGAA